jgi:hypothetical protein
MERREKELSNKPFPIENDEGETEKMRKQAFFSTAVDSCARIHKRENVQLCENFRTPLHPLFRRARFFARLNKLP